MDKKTAIEKIKKCLRLSKSANEHEAGQALKHAQALMHEYGVTDFDISLAEIKEINVKVPKSFAEWQQLLFKVCRNAFGCYGYFAERWETGKGRCVNNYIFYGASPKPELAGYAYDVLLRQLRVARRDYLATELKRVKNPKNRKYRADQFCFGWIAAVHSKVEEFAFSTSEIEKLNAYRKTLNLSGVAKPYQIKVTNATKNSAWLDRETGYEKGKEAQLNHAMNGGEQQKMIGDQS